MAGGAHVMKKVLLGVAAPGTEMFGGKSVKFGSCQATAFWEVKLLQCFHDPNINWERGGESVGKQEYAIGDFAADAG